MKRIAMLVLAAGVPMFVLRSAAPADDPKPVRLLIITGDHGHDWKATTAYFQQFLPKDLIAVDVTVSPAKDLTPDNLKKYDVLLLNYRDTPKGAAERPETVWSNENKQAFLGAVRGGKGLVVYHHTSAAFLEWLEFERCIAGGWRGQGFHGPKHQFTVTVRNPEHPITKGLPRSFVHEVDELYQNSVMFPENVVLATAYSDPTKPEGTGLNEPMIWVKRYGRGRVFVNAMGHEADAMKGVGFQTLMIRGIEWAATGKVTTPVPASLAAAAPAKAVTPEGWGNIRGRVVLAGDAIPERTLLVRKGDIDVKDAAVCAARDIWSEELVVNRENRGVQWVVANVNRPAAIHPELAAAKGEVEFAVESCSFKPHVLAIRVGQKLKIVNRDPTNMNVKIPGFANSWNAIVPRALPTEKVEIDGPQLISERRPIPVQNDNHRWMNAYIWVFNHPYFAVTAETGGFEIHRVPAGKLRLVIWQERIGYGKGGRDGMEVEVQPGETTDLGELSLSLITAN